MSKSQRRYWDANVFLGWFKEEDDKIDACRSVLKQAEAGEITIVTSAITLTEVVYIRNNTKNITISPSTERTLRAFFENDFIELWNADRKICEYARQIVWDQGVRTKDSIHAATALQSDVAKLESYDPDLLDMDGELQRPDQSTLQIGQPRASGQINMPLRGATYDDSFNGSEEAEVESEDQSDS